MPSPKPVTLLDRRIFWLRETGTSWPLVAAATNLHLSACRRAYARTSKRIHAERAPSQATDPPTGTAQAASYMIQAEGQGQVQARAQLYSTQRPKAQSAPWLPNITPRHR